MTEDNSHSTSKLRTLHEAATYMRLKPRTLAKAARKIGACSIFGREILMSEDDIKAVWEANRSTPTIRVVSTASRSDYQIEKRLKELTARRPKTRPTK